MTTLIAEPMTETGQVHTPILFTDDSRAFKRIYRAARTAWTTRYANPLAPYWDATLQVRRFGVEFEFDVSPDAEDNDEDVKGHCAEWLYNHGYIPFPDYDEYHNSRNFQQWRYEADCTVTGGEIITPILNTMLQPADVWNTIDGVTSSIQHLGGDALSTHAGGHVNIDKTGLDGNALERLKVIATRFEDVMYRLATNPYRAVEHNLSASRHRSSYYAAPLGSNPNFGIRNSWLVDRGTRLEFRIFDGSLNANLTQTFVMIASAFVNAAITQDDLIERLEDVPARPRGWHIKQRKEAGFQPRAALSGDAWTQDTLAIREFVDLLFERTEDKERVITLFAMNDWNYKTRRLNHPDF